MTVAGMARGELNALTRRSADIGEKAGTRDPCQEGLQRALVFGARALNLNPGLPNAGSWKCWPNLNTAGSGDQNAALSLGA